jgi:hypothetical protein
MPRRIVEAIAANGLRDPFVNAALEQQECFVPAKEPLSAPWTTKT